MAPAARVEAAGQAVPEAAVVPAAGAEPAVQVLPVAAQGVGPAAPAAEGQVLAADPVVEAVRAELAVETGRRLAAN